MLVWMDAQGACGLLVGCLFGIIQVCGLFVCGVSLIIRILCLGFS